MFKMSALALATVMGAGMSGMAVAAPVVFNTQTDGVLTFNNMVWQAGNGLTVGSLSTPNTIDANNDGTLDTKLVQTVAQSRLASFTVTNGSSVSLSSGEITYQASFWEYATGIGTGTAGFQLANGATPNTFSLYYDPSAPGAGTYGNDTTGVNYGNDNPPTTKLILQGTLSTLTGNYTDFTRLLGNVPGGLGEIVPLDCDAAGTPCPGFDGVDQTPNTLTHAGTGLSTILIDVTYQDFNFFVTNVNSLLIDLSQSVGAAAPFSRGNPWSSIVGETPNYSLVNGVRINGADCVVNNVATGQTQSGTNTTRCDSQFETTGTSTFDVPEPGSLALVGLALAGMGFGASRRRAAA